MMEKPKVFRKTKLDDEEFVDAEKMVKVGKWTAGASAFLAGTTLLFAKNKELIKNTAKQVIEVGIGLIK